MQGNKMSVREPNWNITILEYRFRKEERGDKGERKDNFGLQSNEAQTSQQSFISIVSGSSSSFSLPSRFILACGCYPNVLPPCCCFHQTFLYRSAKRELDYVIHFLISNSTFPLMQMRMDFVFCTTTTRNGIILSLWSLKTPKSFFICVAT